MSIQQHRPEHENHVPATGKTGWHKITSTAEFLKWQYSDTAYRVVVLLDDRGHYRALFTSWYNPESHLIRGGCGGGVEGRMKATAAAHKFMSENKYGCAPPGEMN